MSFNGESDLEQVIYDDEEEENPAEEEQVIYNDEDEEENLTEEEQVIYNDEDEEENPTEEEQVIYDDEEEENPIEEELVIYDDEEEENPTEEGQVIYDDAEEESPTEEEQVEVEAEEISEPQSEDVGADMKYPKSVESLYNLIEPDREDAFNNEINNLNRQLADIQYAICLEHRQRETLKVRRFVFEKELVMESVNDAGILYLPGNFLQPYIARRVDDNDMPFILECVGHVKDFKGFNFAYNEITDEGLHLLSEYIKENPNVSHLNLSHNNFTARGFHYLVTCLMSRVSLMSLKMTGVKVGDKGIDSLTCLYLSGHGPRDLDVSETDMTMPGFQALCSSFQAIDEDDDYPKYLRKHRLPFTLATLAQLKVENHDFIKEQTYTLLTHSHFELVPPKRKTRQQEAESVLDLKKETTEEVKPDETKRLMEDGITQALEDLFTVSFGAGDPVDASKGVNLSSVTNELEKFADQRDTNDELDEFIKEHEQLRHLGCKSKPDGRPVIVCPSLYSLDIDEFVDDEDSEEAKQNRIAGTGKRVNPMFMDTLLETTQAGDDPADLDREVADTLTAQKASAKFVRETLKEAGAMAGVTEYTHDSDVTQLLLTTILETAKRFLEFEVDGGDLTAPELEKIWKHSVETSMKIFRPAIPPHCKVTDETLELFVEQFVKIANLNFYQLLKNPFLFDVFEEAATKGCIEATKVQAREEAGDGAPPLSYDRVLDIVVKFLEEIILNAGEIIGGGDPYNLRASKFTVRTAWVPPDRDMWPSIVDITEEMVEPLVDNFFTAGALLAQDAFKCKSENENSEEEGIEPAKQFLEGVFKELTNFLYKVKDDERKLASRMGKPPRKFTFATKPVRVVLNRPFFAGYEPVMASKLAAFLRNNASVKCLHLRKWDLGEDGMINLMDGVMNNMNIVTLDLASNGIGAEGMKPLAAYLKRNHNLKHLLLNHNRLRNPGILILTQSIRGSGLVSLNIAYNDVTEVGLNPLLHSLRKSKIHSLYVLGNSFSQTSWVILNGLFQGGFLYKPECDIALQEIDGEGVIIRNSQARDMNEWYEVPAEIDIGLACPPYFMEYYPPPKATVFGAAAADMEI